jgi:probable F420-dependent oxidoreductase
MLAALGPRALELAARRSAGALPYATTPEHTRQARRLLGAGRLLAPEQAVLPEADPGRARPVARDFLRYYLGLPNYVNAWRRLGYTDDDFADGGSDRLVDEMVAWGSPQDILRRVGEHLAAGADHVCLQPIASAAGSRLDVLRLLAPHLR